MRNAFLGLLMGAAVSSLGFEADACTRILYETGVKTFLVGRTMDWMEDPKTDLWSFPKGLARDGGVGPGSIKWAAKHGSVVSSFYNVGTVDGLNDSGLVANALYLVESDYGDAATSKKPKLSVGAWTQYALDNFATVNEAVAALQKEPFVIVAPDLPGGHKAGAHLALADASGDSAIFEYLNGKLVIHHGPQYRVMTNSPSYDQQLAINTYWKDVGGLKFLPGTVRAADRFARMSWFLDAAAKANDSEARHGHDLFAHPRHFRSAGHRRSGPAQHRLDDLAHGRRHACAALLFQVGLHAGDFLGGHRRVEPCAGGEACELDLRGKPLLSGEVSDKFAPAEPFKFLSP